MQLRSRVAGRRAGFVLALLASAFLPQAAHAISAPSNLSPNGTTVGPSPTLQWGAVADATWYRVWVTPGTSGSNVLPCAFDGGAVNPGGCWVQATQLAVAGPLAEGAYTWWVQAWSSGGNAWSAATSFTVAPRFEDRGKTVYDHETGLEWEKKTDDGGIHDLDNRYTWGQVDGVSTPNGTAFTQFLAGLNGDGCVSQSADSDTLSNVNDCAFAGHSDWRIPTITELKTIADCNFLNPPNACIDPVFGPTELVQYWSSTWWPNQAVVWTVNFALGSTNQSLPASGAATSQWPVRAVRGGQ